MLNTTELTELVKQLSAVSLYEYKSLGVHSRHAWDFQESDLGLRAAACITVLSKRITELETKLIESETALAAERAAYEQQQEVGAADIETLQGELAAEREKVKGLEALVKRASEIFTHCNVSEGVCCCGDNMETHADPMSCGHSPVDHGGYVADQWIKDVDALAAGGDPAYDHK